MGKVRKNRVCVSCVDFIVRVLKLLFDLEFVKFCESKIFFIFKDFKNFEVKLRI